jgi:hypothetical protein
MADLVEETVRGIRARLRELAPVVAEYERLEAAYAALDGERRAGEGGRAGVGTAGRRSGRARSGPGRSSSRRSRARAKRGQNKAAVYGVIAQRPGVTVPEIAAVTGIAKPLIYNTTRAGIERGELEKVALPGGRAASEQRSLRPRARHTATANAHGRGRWTSWTLGASRATRPRRWSPRASSERSRARRPALPAASLSVTTFSHATPAVAGRLAIAEYFGACGVTPV